MKNVKKVKKCLKVGCTVKNDHGTKRLHCLTFLRNLEHVYAQNGFYTFSMIHVFIQDNLQTTPSAGENAPKIPSEKILDKNGSFFACKIFGFLITIFYDFQHRNARESSLGKISDTSFFFGEFWGFLKTN